MPTYPKKKRIRVEAKYEPLSRLGPYRKIYIPRPILSIGFNYGQGGLAIPPLTYPRVTAVPPPPEVEEIEDTVSSVCLPATPSSPEDLQNNAFPPVESRLDFSISEVENLAYLETTGSSNGENPFGLVNREMLSGESGSIQGSSSMGGDFFARFKARVYSFFTPIHYPIRFFGIEKPVYYFPQDPYVDGSSSTVSDVIPKIPGYTVDFGGEKYYYGEFQIVVNEDFGRMSYEFLHTPNPGSSFQATLLGALGGSGNMVFDSGCMPDTIDPDATTTPPPPTLPPGVTTTTLEPTTSTTAEPTTTTISPAESFFEEPSHPYDTFPETDVTHPDFGSYLEYMPYGMYQLSMLNGVSYIVNPCKIHDRNDVLTFFEPGLPDELITYMGNYFEYNVYTPTNPSNTDINGNRIPFAHWNSDFLYSKLNLEASYPHANVEDCNADYLNNAEYWYDSPELFSRSSLPIGESYVAGGLPNPQDNLRATVLYLPDIAIRRIQSQEAKLLAKGISRTQISRARIYINFFRDAGNTIVDTLPTNRGDEILGDYSAYSKIYWIKQFMAYDSAPKLFSQDAFTSLCLLRFNESGAHSPKHGYQDFIGGGNNAYYFWANQLGFNSNPG